MHIIIMQLIRLAPYLISCVLCTSIDIVVINIGTGTCIVTEFSYFVVKMHGTYIHNVTIIEDHVM